MNQVAQNRIYLDSSGTLALPEPTVRVHDILVTGIGTSASVKIVDATGVPVFGVAQANNSSTQYRFTGAPIVMMSPLTITLNKCEVYIRTGA